MIGTDRRRALAERRAQLVQRAAQQRQQLGIDAAPLVRPWRWVERGIVAWQFVRRRPWLAVAPIAAWAWWRPRGMNRGLAAALALWRASRSLRRRHPG